MMELTTLSWNTFFTGCLILFLIGLWTTRTNRGRFLIDERTPWTSSQWMRVLLVMGITLFILVHPLFHLLAAAVIFGLYYLLVKNRLFDFSGNSNSSNATLTKSLFADSRQKSEYLTLICEGVDHDNLSTERRELDKCLFSFPFILPTPATKVDYFGGKYTVQVALSSGSYLDSFVHYIEQAGFKIEIKNNN